MRKEETERERRKERRGEERKEKERPEWIQGEKNPQYSENIADICLVWLVNWVCLRMRRKHRSTSI
jgi:hypothetical protein